MRKNKWFVAYLSGNTLTPYPNLFGSKIGASFIRNLMNYTLEGRQHGVVEIESAWDRATFEVATGINPDTATLTDIADFACNLEDQVGLPVFLVYHSGPIRA